MPKALTVSRNKINESPTPEETISYIPVPYGKIIDTMEEKAHKTLPGEYYLSKARYQILEDNSKMMATHVYKKSPHDKMGISFFSKSSHDGRWPVTFLFGEGNITACFNGMIFGALKYSVSARRHTGNVLKEIPIAAEKASEGVWDRFSKLNEDMETLKRKPFGDDDMYKFAGLLQGKGVIKPKHFKGMIKEWHQPSYREFKRRNMWSAYNAATQVFKSAPVSDSLTMHSNLHDIAMQY